MTEKTQPPSPLESSVAKCGPTPSAPLPVKTERKVGGRKPRHNLAGKQFDRLTAIRPAEDYITSAGQAKTRWVCKCLCGNETTVLTVHLNNRATRSCGCLARDTVIARSTIHGHANRGSKGRTYRIWCAMKTRCSNHNQPNAHRYVDRGIEVCAEWVNSYEQFLADMGECPPRHSLDRKDNNLGYSKSNCRWATGVEQANNTCRNRFIEHGGERLTLAQWSVRCGVNAETISSRLSAGMSVAAALTTPADTRFGRRKNPCASPTAN
jgi:hypothetical protein